MQTLRMIIEMRTYKIKPALRAKFLEMTPTPFSGCALFPI
jgi:hypothetical protein